MYIRKSRKYSSKNNIINIFLSLCILIYIVFFILRKETNILQTNNEMNLFLLLVGLRFLMIFRIKQSKTSNHSFFFDDFLILLISVCKFRFPEGFPDSHSR